MSCPKPYDLIEVAFRLLPTEELQAADDHVAECESCGAELREVRTVHDRLGALPEAAPSAGFVTRVRRAFVEANPDLSVARPAVRIRRPSWVWPVALHAAAFLVAALYFATHIPPTPPPDLELLPTRGGKQPPADDRRTAQLNELWDRTLKNDPFPDFMESRQKSEQRSAQVQLRGGERSRGPVRDALNWLANHQETSGAWGESSERVAVTSIATLSLLAEGNRPGVGSYAINTQRAVEFLLDVQDARGRVGTELLQHAMASAALVEAAVLGGDLATRRGAEAALAYLIETRADDGGWGTRSRAAKHDPVVTAWAAQAMRLSFYLDSRLAVPVLAGIERTAADSTGAAGLWTRVMSVPGLTRDALAQEPIEPVERHLTTLHFGSLAVYQLSDKQWRRWNFSMIDMLTSTQTDDGSWPAGYDLDAPARSEAYTTALCTLILQTYYRYPPSLK